jgi:arabinofuranosyltransferase
MSHQIHRLCFLIIATVFVLHAVYLGVVAEDAYISFRFAKNLAAGNGLLWNVGEAPVEGYTNFLWIILNAMALRLGLDVGRFSQVLGLVASLVSLAYVYLFCRRLMGHGPYLSLLPCAYLALSGPFATWATSGMETNFFTMLVLSATYHMVSYWRQKKVTSLTLAFSLMTLAALTRPEGLGIFCILAGMHLLRGVFQGGLKELARGAMAAAVFFILPFSVYFLWRFGYYGYLLPNTFYAKTGGTIYQWIRGARYLFLFCFHFISPVIPLLTAIATSLLWDTHWTTGHYAGFLKAGRHWFIKSYATAVPLSLSLLYGGYIILVGGDYMAMYRFIVPILPFIYVLLCHGTSILYADTSGRSHRRVLATGLVIFGMIGTFVQSTPLERYLFAEPGKTHGQYRGVLHERWHCRRLAVIGKFFDHYKADERESVATNAIGAVGYYSNMRVYDFNGLVDTHIAHQRQQTLGKGLPGHEKHDLLYTVAEKEPTYFIFNRELRDKPGQFPGDYRIPNGLSPDVVILLQRNYDMISKWLEDEENGESGYFCFLQRKPRPERQQPGQGDAVDRTPHP